MKRLASVVFLVAILLSVTGCKKKITSGEVIEKNYTPAHTSVNVVPIITTNGKSTYTFFVPYTYYYPDKWEITIQAWNEENSEMQYATFRVDESVYDKVEIGAEFVYDESMEPNEPEYTRKKIKEE